MKLKKMIILQITLLILIISACNDSTEENTAPVPAPAASTEIIINIASPPPGSNADQTKWDTFSDEKKQESWNKYVADNTSTTPTTVPASDVEVKKPGSGGGSSIVPVAVGELTKAPMNIFYYGLGELAAGDEIRVAPGTSGTVAALYVSEGDFIEPGDLLFSLDNNDLIKTIERTSDKWNNDLELASIKLDEARGNNETTSSLYAKELISKLEYDKAKQTLEEAELSYEKTQLAKTTEIENLQENLRTTLAISHGRGYVSNITFTRGEIVNSADYVEIIDIEKIAVSIKVPENIITRIKNGQRVVAKQASAPDYILEGRVSTVGLKADNNRSYEVLAVFDNPNQRLLPGMLIEAQIQLTRTNSNFIVPKESVVNQGTDSFIFLIKDGSAKKTPVITGQSRGILVQISGAVNEGDLIVLSGQTYLQNGTLVNVIEKREYLPESIEF